MNFLSLTPLQAAMLLAATGAAVVVLYWLRPPPKRVVVPSSLIWNRLLRQKRRSSLIDRLRWWISLLIALAIGLSVALSLSRPEIESISGELRQIAVVVDNSATMATRSSDGFSRWDHAVTEARRLLRQGSQGGEFLVADTSGQAPPTEPVERRRALEVLDGLSVALGGTPQFPTLAVDDAELYFITDGVMVSEVPPEATVISVFEPADNVGITAFEIRSVPSDPLRYQAFYEVTNTSLGPKDATIRLSGSGSSRLQEPMRLEPGESMGRTIDLAGFDRGPVRAVVTTDSDGFAADDYAYAYLPVRRRTRIALVSPGSVYLETILSLDPRIQLNFMTPDQYSDQVVADIFVFDRYAPAAPPSGPALVFLPPDVPWLAPTLEVVASPPVDTWDTEHPVLQFVALEDLRIDRAARPAVRGGAGGAADPSSAETGVPSRDEVIVGTARMPLIIASETPERVLRVSFALEDSNFPLQPAFPIFLSNALSWVMDEQVALPRSPGRVEVPLPGARVVDLEGNEVTSWPLLEQTVFVADEPGLYTASLGGRRLRVAVNVSDRSRSSVNDSQLGAIDAAAGPTIDLSVLDAGTWAEELWMTLLAVAALLVIAEWFTYHKRWTV